MNTKTHYDIVGDIHGHASALRRLLAELGYRPVGKAFRAPTGRKALFLGDYIDRGPEVRETLEIVRGMVENGSALAILGNHEVNALRYHTEGPNGQPLREHHGSKLEQHRATLEQLADPYPTEWHGWLDWFAGLPVWLDLGPIRAVHAAWDPDAIRDLGRVGPLAGPNLLVHSEKGTDRYEALETLLCGHEIDLPEGSSFQTGDGAVRRNIRSTWWEDFSGKTFREIVFPGDDRIPAVLVPATTRNIRYPGNAPPVFFGHYAVMDDQPVPLRPNVACVDYGSGKGGLLTAYRWSGESELLRENFVSTQTKG